MKIVEHEILYYTWKVAKGKTVRLKEGMMYCISSNLALVEGGEIEGISQLTALINDQMILDVKKGHKYSVRAFEDMTVIGVAKEELFNYIERHYAKSDLMVMLIKGLCNSTSCLFEQMAILQCPNASTRINQHFKLYEEELYLNDGIRAKLTNTTRETCCRMRTKNFKED